VTQLVIVIGKTVDDKYYFRVRTDAGRILLTSREFMHIEKCMNEIYRIQQYCDFEMAVEHGAHNGNKYTLIGRLGKTVGESPYYAYSYEMRRDMDLMRSFLQRAEVIDNSALVRFFRAVRI
jgi:hypothetical protein